jgi:hypothetical protein
MVRVDGGVDECVRMGAIHEERCAGSRGVDRFGKVGRAREKVDGWEWVKGGRFARLEKAEGRCRQKSGAWGSSPSSDAGPAIQGQQNDLEEVSFEGEKQENCRECAPVRTMLGDASAPASSTEPELLGSTWGDGPLLDTRTPEKYRQGRSGARSYL